MERHGGATLAEVAAATGNARYGRRAEEIGEFLWSSMYADARLMRSWQGGRARHLAVAADTPGWPRPAFASRNGPARSSGASGRTAVDELLELFWDEESGGFFSSGSDAEIVVVRPKEFLDGALPSTNSVGVYGSAAGQRIGRRCSADAAVERTIALARPLLSATRALCPT